METEKRIEKVIEFYKTNNRFINITEDDRDLVDIVCHIRHAGDSRFGYKSLKQRFPKECEFIQEKEKEIFISKELEKFKEFLEETEKKEEQGKRAPKVNKKELRIYMFWLWCKEELKEDILKLNFLFSIDEEMEVITDFTLPDSNAIKRMKSEGQEIHNTDLIRVEELQNKVSKYWKIKDNLFKHYGRFMNCPYEYDYRFNLELQTAMNEFIAEYEEFDNYLKEKEIVSLMRDNHYIKEVVEDEISRKIIFRGEHYIEKEGPKKKKPRKRSKKEEA